MSPVGEWTRDKGQGQGIKGNLIEADLRDKASKVETLEAGPKNDVPVRKARDSFMTATWKNYRGNETAMENNPT